RGRCERKRDHKRTESTDFRNRPQWACRWDHNPKRLSFQFERGWSDGDRYFHQERLFCWEYRPCCGCWDRNCLLWKLYPEFKPLCAWGRSQWNGPALEYKFRYFGEWGLFDFRYGKYSGNLLWIFL